MALNFPSSPTVGQVFISEGATFVWSGTVWYVLDPFPWATPAEGVEGLATGLVMTPAATKAVLDPLSAGQTFTFGVPTNLTASRSANVNYQNTIGRPMMIAATFWDRDAGSQAELRIGAANANPPALIAARTTAFRGDVNTIVGVIPAGWWYQLNAVANRPGVSDWWEWR